MDLTSALVGLQQSQTLSAVQIRVAKMVMDNAQSQGDAAVKLIQSANIGVNRAADNVESAVGSLGTQMDTYA